MMHAATKKNEPEIGKKPLIEVEGLRHTYGSNEVLFLESWQLQSGTNQLLVGPSGSGKTTLISILTGLMQPSSGTVQVLGQQISGLRTRELDRLRVSVFGLVFQDHHLVSSLSVAENLALAQHFAGQKQDRSWANHLLEQLGLRNKQQAKPASLSAGEAQRAAIARAAVCKPKILIADEPTSALDDKNTEDVVGLLKSLCSLWGATLLVASHDARIKPHFQKCLDLGSQKACAS